MVVSDATLFEAIKANDIAKVRYLLDHGANVNALVTDTGKYGNYEDTPLTEAILAKNIDMARLLLDRGANVNVHLKNTSNDPNERWYYCYTSPLTKAIARKSIDLVRLLLDSGADINVRWGWTEQNNNVEKFSECNWIFTRYSCPLVDAIGEKNIDIVRLLLERGAKVNTEGGATRVPLIKAVETGNLDIVRLLLAQDGIDVNATHDVTPTLTWDDYEAIGYSGGTDADFQLSRTHNGTAGSRKQRPNCSIAACLRREIVIGKRNGPPPGDRSIK
ncbi:MAG: ankyrin repeat domain-containing protein [Puniceicoccales bacterium]|nr:ankyrin repeat domain-containing protein [Puniceicoccales bacterium]